MNNFSVSKSPKSKYKNLSLRLESLVQECEVLENSDKLHKEMSKNFLNLNSKLESLKKIDLNYYNEKSITSKKIEAYLRQKFYSQDAPITEIRKNSKQYNRFSFEKNNKTSFSKPKRKFGKHWDDDFQSFDSTGITKIPEAQTKSFDYDYVIKTTKNETKNKKTERLKTMIKNFLEKKIGVRYFTDSNYQKPHILDRKIVKSKNLSRLKQLKPSIFDQENGEKEYLSSDYYKYKNNPIHKLKLEKIIFAKHQKERKQYQLINQS